MTRSCRHTAIVGNCPNVRSEKKDKAIWHRKARAWVRDRLCDFENYIEILDREVSDPWGMDKDGKKYFDIRQYPHLMRK